MANPSLQIGNGKFAIKENDLLGYSSSGTRFFPIPITMTRATLGSRVNPSGLIEDVELLGNELVTCGSFDCADPDAVWTRGTGWTISNGIAEHNGSGGGNLDQTMDITNGDIYKVTFTILNSTQGSLGVYLSGGFGGNFSNGTHTIYITGGSASSYDLRFVPISSFIGEIDNVSVKEATIDGLARVDYTDGTASLLVEPQRTNIINYSNVFTNQSATLTPNYGISPDGTQNSTQVQASGSNSGVRINMINSSNNAFAYSVYVKGVLGETVNVRVETSPYSLLIQYNFILNGEWQRIENVLTASATHTQRNFYITKLGSSTATDFQVYGAQVEEGSYPTSYIPTSGSTVTRNQDQYEKTGISDKINSEEGVLFLEMKALSNDLSFRRIGLSDSTANNRVDISYDDVSNRIRGQVIVGGVNSALMTFVATDITQNSKIALKYKLNDFALWIDGTEVATDTSGSVYAVDTLNKLSFDAGAGGNVYSGKVKQLQVYKTALSDSELATLTT